MAAEHRKGKSKGKLSSHTDKRAGASYSKSPAYKPRSGKATRLGKPTKKKP